MRELPPSLLTFVILEAPLKAQSKRVDNLPCYYDVTRNGLIFLASIWSLCVLGTQFGIVLPARQGGYRNVVSGSGTETRENGLTRAGAEKAQPRMPWRTHSGKGANVSRSSGNVIPFLGLAIVSHLLRVMLTSRDPVFPFFFFFS